ncbi:MAG: endo alpha-1,4 polygalactosaminidase [Rhodobacteraceae bacterium]|nr:endo alpha-1,4 polygalactosaminidase [Paracoccaceae bacterium]
MRGRGSARRYPAIRALWALVLLALGPAFAGEIGKTGAHWDWQLTEPFDLSVDVQVIDLDPDSVTPSQIAALKARGVKTICYVSVGTVESYRDDAELFPEHVLGAVYDDWPNERFLDIRQLDAILPLMTARFDRCRALGFDAVEPDNMDLFENETGLPITAAHQIAYLRPLIAYAHRIGLEIGQKNAPDLIPALHRDFDFIILESCFHYGFCDDALVYAQEGKDVLAAEYSHMPVDRRAACAFGAKAGIRFIFKERELAAGGQAC